MIFAKYELNGWSRQLTFQADNLNFDSKLCLTNQSHCLLHSFLQYSTIGVSNLPQSGKNGRRSVQFTQSTNQCLLVKIGNIRFLRVEFNLNLQQILQATNSLMGICSRSVAHISFTSLNLSGVFNAASANCILSLLIGLS